MKWFFDNDLAVICAFFLLLCLGGGIGATVERSQRNDCLVQLAKAGKSTDEAKGLCK